MWRAVKIGMLSQPEIIHEIAEVLETYKPPFLVVDPVMVATSGDPLISSEAIDALKERLIPLATIITPNIPEAQKLSRKAVLDMETSAVGLLDLGCKSVLLKGGHLKEAVARDVLAMQGSGVQEFSAPRVDTPNTHGTGCTLSSAIAAYLAKGEDIPSACEKSKGLSDRRSGSFICIAGRAWAWPRSSRVEIKMDEFAAIEKYFAPLTMGREEAAGLQDDAAVLAVPEGCELVVTSDTLNEGVHFIEGEAPDVIARKALRVNLSDLAAMGAKPLCYQLNIAFPKPPEGAWLKAFSGALLEENRLYDVFCSGGDTTGIKSEGLSIQRYGFWRCTKR